MWLSDKWKDYELLDASDGERLERWGGYTLVRPDPQAIWHTPRGAAWRGYDARYVRSATGGGAWENKTLPGAWTVGYNNLTFNIKPMAFKHTGVFPEQAANWDFAANIIKKRVAAGQSVRVLNLFAYTGAATVNAALAGAEVCHVDAARGMVSWAKENAKSSGAENAPIRWIVDDCAAFVARELRRGHSYDAIIMDPPSYGRGPTGQIWKIEDDLYGFTELCMKLLTPNPAFVLVSSYSTGLSPSVIGYILSATNPRGKARVQCEELGLPVSSSKLALPCGASARMVW
jgi:23S rRNA (cytosine1962-C5)-methyltransferase